MAFAFIKASPIVKIGFLERTAAEKHSEVNWEHHYSLPVPNWTVKQLFCWVMGLYYNMKTEYG